MCIYIYIYIYTHTHTTVHLKLTQHCKSTILSKKFPQSFLAALWCHPHSPATMASRICICVHTCSVQFRSVQSLSRVQLFATPWIAARQASLSMLSRVQVFVTPWTVACQALLSMRFPRQEYWSGCRALLQGIFPTPRSNLCLNCRQIFFLTIEPMRKP